MCQCPAGVERGVTGKNKRIIVLNRRESALTGLKHGVNRRESPPIGVFEPGVPYLSAWSARERFLGTERGAFPSLLPRGLPSRGAPSARKRWLGAPAGPAFMIFAF